MKTDTSTDLSFRQTDGRIVVVEVKHHIGTRCRRISRRWQRPAPRPLLRLHARRRQPRRQRTSIRLCRPGGRKKRPRRGSSAADGGGDAASHTAVRAASAPGGAA
jgi:hypothetical protein